MWWDSYPYSTLSVHALHPQYLALRACLERGQVMPPGIAAQVRLGVGGGECGAAAARSLRHLVISVSRQGW